MAQLEDHLRLRRYTLLSEYEAGVRLLRMLVRSRASHEFPRPPYVPGLLTSGALTNIVDSISEEMETNARIARAAQVDHASPILRLAQELKLDPRPAGHDASTWIAECPRRKHTIMILPAKNIFGCGYCRRKGGPTELQKFYDDVG